MVAPVLAATRWMPHIQQWANARPRKGRLTEMPKYSVNLVLTQTPVLTWATP